MPPPDPVADYLDRLTDELRFEPALARRVRLEVEDHLRQAVAELAGCAAPEEAKARAIARFGEPRAIARQYAPAALFGQTRRVGVIVLIVLGGIYAMMKGRLAWYGFTEWRLTPDLAAVATTAFSMARWIFIVALAVTVVGAAYIGSRRPPHEFHDACRRQLWRCVMLCAAAAFVLLVAIGLDGVMVGLRLVGREPSATILVPLLSMAVEASLAVVLVRTLGGAIRHAAIARSLLSR